MSKLLLVRHGITEFNSARMFVGHTDAELSTEGHQQVEKLRDRLATEKIDAIYTSNLRRASASAEIIAAAHQLDVVGCDELNEVDFGNKRECLEARQGTLEHHRSHHSEYHQSR